MGNVSGLFLVLIMLLLFWTFWFDFFVIFLFVALFRIVCCFESYPSNSAIFVLFKCLWFFFSL